MANKLFLKFDKDGSKTLDISETKELLQQLHIEINNKYLKQIFKQYDKDGNNHIDYEEFQCIIKNIMRKKEVIPIFNEYCKNNYEDNDDEGLLNFEELMEFFEEEQKEKYSIEEILINLKKILPSRINSTEKISFRSFTNILFAKNNTIFDTQKSEIYQVNKIYSCKK